MPNVTLNLSQALGRALAACNQGKLIKAEQLCQQIIAAKSDLFDAYHLLAFVQAKLGKKDAALQNYDSAIALQPTNVEALNNRGNALKQLNRFEEAIASYDRALSLKPAYAEALNNRGNAWQELKRFNEALSDYDRALAVRPDYPEAFNNRGYALHQLKRFDEAVASYDRALASRPDYVEALNNRGNALQELKRFDQALLSYDRALALRPDYAEALNNRGGSLKALNRLDEALAGYDRALNLQPGYADAFYNRGNTLMDMKRFDEALASYDRALSLKPAYAEAHNNRGNALQRLKRFDEALASYQRALTIRADYAEAINNCGVTLKQLRRFDDASACYARAISLGPDFAEAHYNQALCRLLIGDFDLGWREHEWRWQCDWLRSTQPHFNQPLWLGKENVSGKTILLHSEQGYGDSIQFCRYVPLLAGRGARVMLWVPDGLDDLMSTLAGASQIISPGRKLPDFDLHCPLLSLPLAFGTRLETIPAATPYLHASPKGTKHWAKRLKSKYGPKIGLAWSGRPTHPNDHSRSIALTALVPLFDIDATFVSLQKDVRSEDREVLKRNTALLDFTDDLKDFSDTAALIANLDLVISVDTSVAHLAGALAKPVWVLPPFIPDWRWLLDRDDSPWYPTARLFRQDETRTWDNVIARVRSALLDFTSVSLETTVSGRPRRSSSKGRPH